MAEEVRCMELPTVIASLPDVLQGDKLEMEKLFKQAGS